MPKLTHVLGATIAASALTLSACGTQQGQPATTTGDQLNVVVAFYPLQFVAERVGGADAKITNLTQPGAEAHDVELTPRQIAQISEADVVIYEKGFQPAVDTAIEQAKPANALDVATVVKLHPMTDTGDHVHDAGATPAPDDHGHDEHAHDTGATPTPDEHSGDEHAHDDTGTDPHIWLDPTNMVTISNSVADTMGRARPDEAAAFRTNAAALNDELTALDGAFRTGLQTCQRREFVVSHAAFGYLADRYNLVQIPLRGLSPDVEPSPARIAEVQGLAREHGITTIFYETLVSPAVAKSVAGDLGLKTDVLDPLEGVTDASRGKNYIEIMNANLSSLKAANGCQ